MVNGYGYTGPGRVAYDKLIGFEATGRELEVLHRDACKMLAHGRFSNPPGLNR